MKKDQTGSNQEMATSVSPMRRRATVQGVDITKKKGSAIVKGKQNMSLFKYQQAKDKTADQSSSKVNLKDSQKATLEEEDEND